jgi:hypothetical protein
LTSRSKENTCTLRFKAIRVVNITLSEGVYEAPGISG